MSLWRRISQSKLQQATHHIERRFFEASAGSSRRYRVPASSFGAKARPLAEIRRWDNLGFCSNVRFFAAPFQVKPKEKEQVPKGPRLNEQIQAREVRLVADEGDHRILPFYRVLQDAKSKNLDVVEVDRTANPPVVKIMDFHMEQYKRQREEKERAKAKAKTSLKSGLKEVRFAVKTEAKDLTIKADGIKRLMDRGYRVKCMATGKQGEDLGGSLAQMFALIEDLSIVESGPKVERKQAYVIVRHMKFECKKMKKVDVNAEIERQKIALAEEILAEEQGIHVTKSEKTERVDLHNKDAEPGNDGIAYSTNEETPIPNYSHGSHSDFRRPAQAQADRAPAQEALVNRYAKPAEQGRMSPPQNPVDNSNWGRYPRDSFRSGPGERAQMPPGNPRHDRPYPNFPRNSSAPPGPGGPRPQGAGPYFGRAQRFEK